MSTSTPMKLVGDKPDVCNISIQPSKEQVSVVAISPKLKTKPFAYDNKLEGKEQVKSPSSKIPASPIFETKLKLAEKKSPTTPPSPLPKPKGKAPSVPLSPIAKNKSFIPISKERIQVKASSNASITDKSPSPSISLESPLTPSSSDGAPKWVPSSPISPRESELVKLFGFDCDDELAQFELEAIQMMRRMDLMLITVGGVDNERDPGKRLEVQYYFNVIFLFVSQLVNLFILNLWFFRF